MTGIPARAIPATRSAISAPPSSLMASQPASAMKRPALRIADLDRRLVAHVGHVADDQRGGRPAPHRRRVADHVVHRHRQGGVEAQHRHAQAVADEDHVDPGLLLEVGGRVVVAGQPRDRRAVRDLREQRRQGHLLALGHGPVPPGRRPRGGVVRAIIRAATRRREVPFGHDARAGRSAGAGGARATRRLGRRAWAGAAGIGSGAASARARRGRRRLVRRLLVRLGRDGDRGRPAECGRQPDVEDEQQRRRDEQRADEERR